MYIRAEKCRKWGGQERRGKNRVGKVKEGREQAGRENEVGKGQRQGCKRQSIQTDSAPGIKTV